MSSPVTSLLKANFRTWIGAKGFWLVAAAALLPLVLTGAWVGAHRADVAVTELRIDGAPYSEGDEARFTAVVTNVGKQPVGEFNISLAVGTVTGGRLFAADSTTLTVDALAAGESREVTLLWSATPGVVYVVATVDPEDNIGERDEFNNQKAEPLAVARDAPDPATAPTAPMGLAGDENATTEIDLVVESLTRSSEGIAPGNNVTFTVTVRNNGIAVENAEVGVRVSRSFAGRGIPVTNQTQVMSFEAGETKTLDVVWTAQDGVFWHEGLVYAPTDTRDVNPDNNFLVEPVVVNPVVTDAMRPPEPQERLTIKQFYLQVLSLLHLRLLLPLIALFYAAGVIADERERGSLPYVLTRPIPRWLIPITKFAASFAVAAVATVVGVLLTYLFLFGTTVEGGDIGFLTTPLLASLLTLFVYGALFILLGVLVERPYLVGLLIVLGWENAAAMFVPWVSNLTLGTHIGNALADWRLDQGLQWVPETEAGVRALLVILGVGVAFLVLASAQMRRRDFAVG
ncbi:MAG TPA: CARDB domain-containing protein [Candidatus Thermoplasmatota archaeon]|nr:CARDB domain-containing protein [Candidatus Thermoplasmatota archaeon]